MELDDLKKQLYKKDGELKDRPEPPEEFEAGHLSAPPQAPPASQWTGEVEKGLYLTIKQKRIAWFIGLGFLLAILTFGGWLIWQRWYSFDAKGVALNIFGQERVVSGEEINFVVRYKNNANTELKNAALFFSFSSQSIPSEMENVSQQGDLTVVKKEIGSILPGQEGQAEFKVRVLGDKDSQQKFFVKMSYRPANFNSNFINETEFQSVIISVPLVLSFILPERIVSGQTINFSLRYLNTSDVTFSDAKIKIEYPDGFVFENALPWPSEEKNVWNFSEISNHEEGKIVLKGVISGNEGENKAFRAQIGSEKDGKFIVYAQALSSPQVSLSPLFIEQTVGEAENNQVDLGQNLTYKIKYKNTTDVAIGPVVITAKIDSQAVDLGTVIVSKGFFSSSEGIITWNASSLPSLESLPAKAEGEINFMLRVKDKLSINSFSDKNFTIITRVKIDSPNIPLELAGTQLAGQNELSLKVNSRMVLEMKGFYSDKIMPNSGPLPPRVGQKTTYTIYWQVLNISNDLSVATVEAFLPSYVQWQGKTYPKDENIKYDSSTGRITWQIGRLSSATGLLSPVKLVAFQVGFVPSLGQVGEITTIVKEARAFGIDDFTGVNLSALADDLKTDMPDDATVGFEKGKVQN